ncbi:hypothetical protein DTO027B5_1875 [Paecilomyces variotii]|nr:hypothetical protein DTO169C6_1029 [Paecilomyces variotii]KAJ9327487.1 hypothetical protein DTO027B3_1709 [Paecilomyces variotii]KAJ9336194.1 hypothetical protein DTO027B5_1875 [Paecilomyces variotii]KAJ9406396.1 hypothetical protein DTO045G8_5785 [Paecilomyces variotii]
MALNIGQIIKGRYRTYRLTEVLKVPTVFKAQVLPELGNTSTPVVLKTELGPEKICLKREQNNYRIPAITSCKYIRQLCDVISPGSEELSTEKADSAVNSLCLVFEWMDHDLRTVPSFEFRSNSDLPKIISKAVLSALALLSQLNAVHTVKVGDLGNMLLQGYNKIRLQSLPTRAPEVWRGLGCFHSSDVWSFGITLVHWLAQRPIFGAKDKIVENLTEAWCIAKIRRLVGPFGPPVNNPDYEEEFFIAEYLESTTFSHPDTGAETPFIKVGSLRQELERLPGPVVSPELLDFIEYLLVVDHTKRPTASEALQHPYLRSLPEVFS